MTDELIEMGTKADMRRCTTVRIDDKAFQINHARKLIFENGYVVSGKAIDMVLGDVSLVPTKVEWGFFFVLLTDLDLRMPSHQN
jgi:hypothetical protein